MRKVSIGQYFRTIHDVNDGFGGKRGSCREYTLPRGDQYSEPTGWIRGHTRIGPVCQVRVICCGVEMQTVHVEKRMLLLDCATWMNLGTTKKTLLKTLRG